MKKLFLLTILAASFFASEISVSAQTAPSVGWDKTFGGSLDDSLTCTIPTADGGYLHGGASRSDISGDRTQASQGGTDYWVVKTDAFGNKIWDKTFGGMYFDCIKSVVQANDGGYVLAGDSYSPVSGDKSQPSRGASDFWVVKIDASGNKIWDKTFGGFGIERLCEIKRTIDGGYIFGGTSHSFISGDKTQAPRGGTDYWVVKIDANGNKVWDKTFGGSLDDKMYALTTTADGGFILGGGSESWTSGDKSDINNGSYDYWIVKINWLGYKQWDKTFGSWDDDWVNVIQQTADGGYVLGGTSRSGPSSTKTEYRKGGFDYWIVKTDATGNQIWDKTIGGLYEDAVSGLQIMPDGNYVIGGTSKSPISGDKTQNYVGGTINKDYWVVKLDATGNKIWDKTIGSGADDACKTMAKTINGDLILGGWSLGGISGDKTQASRGAEDYWIVKLNPTCADLTATISATCSTSGTNLNLNITGIQPAATGTPSWTLTYTVNGVTQTATGITNTFALATNAIAGTTYSLVSISSGSCTNNLTGTFTVQPAPTAPTVTPGNSCGTGPVTLLASGAPTGGKYIWYNAPTMGVMLQNSASGTFTTPSISSNTTYYVSIINNAGCESQRTPVTATVTYLTVTPGSALTICASAAPVQLSGYNPAGGTWSGPGVSATGLFTPNSSLFGSQTITYTVTQNGCIDSVTQSITVTAAPVVSAGFNDTVCASAAPFQLTGTSPSGGTWSGPGISATGLFTPTQALTGTQILTYSYTQNGCTITSAKNMVVLMPPAQPIISQYSPDTLIASTAGSSYEWKYNNTVIPGNKQKLKVIAPGTYAVRVKDVNNCTSAFSTDFMYTISGLEDQFQNSFSLYPNPTSGQLTLEMHTAQPAEVIIYNALGQQVMQKMAGKNDKKLQLELSKVAKGIYLVQISTEKQLVVKRVVVE